MNVEHASATTVGKVFVLSGPSGVGKSSLLKEVLQRIDGLQLSVSHTTRKPRTSEKNGKEYYFVSSEEFSALVSEDSFLESAKVFGHCYGTSKEFVEQQVKAGKSVILEVDWQGARSVREYFSDAISIFVLPVSKDDLHQRIVGRGQDSADIIKQRMDQAMSEMRHFNEFDYCIVNDDFMTAYQTLEQIIRYNRQDLNSKQTVQETLSNLDLAQAK